MVIDDILTYIYEYFNNKFNYVDIKMLNYLSRLIYTNELRDAIIITKYCTKNKIKLCLIWIVELNTAVIDFKIQLKYNYL